MTLDETDSLRYGDTSILYTIRRRPGRKSGKVAIHVEPDGRVLVDVPEGASADRIRATVTARSRWIHKHLLEIRRRRSGVLPREYVSGESLLYLGRRYRLKVVVDPDRHSVVLLRAGYIETAVHTRKPAAVRAVLDAWYRRRARAVFEARLMAIASSLRWMRGTPFFRIRNMKVQWGSCSPEGRLTLNPHLVKAPRECIDYVMLHELCHLKVRNHGPDFYRLLDRHLPDWQHIKARLDEQAEVVLNT